MQQKSIAAPINELVQHPANDDVFAPGVAGNMSSFDLLDLINVARIEAQESPVRRNDFTARCLDELSGENYETFVVANPNGTRSEAVSLTRDQCMYVSMRESKAVRRTVTTKLNELASRAVAPVLPDFANPVAAARAWADATEAKQRAEVLAQDRAILIEQQKPKIEFADTLLNAEGTTLVRDVAKIIGVPVKMFYCLLKEKGVVLANNAPSAEYVAKGYFKEGTNPYETLTRGTQIGHTARVTGLGIEFLRRFAKRHADRLVAPPRAQRKPKSKVSA